MAFFILILGLLGLVFGLDVRAEVKEKAANASDKAAFTKLVEAYENMAPFEGMDDILLLPRGFDYKPFMLQDEASLEKQKHPHLFSIPICNISKAVGKLITPSDTNHASSDAPTIHTETICETTEYSPETVGIIENFEYLKGIEGNWCCRLWDTRNGCQTMHRSSYREATDICTSEIGTCIRCGWAARANLRIALSCTKNKLAGGFRRYICSWLPKRFSALNAGANTLPGAPSCGTMARPSRLSSSTCGRPR